MPEQKVTLRLLVCIVVLIVTILMLITSCNDKDTRYGGRRTGSEGAASDSPLVTGWEEKYKSLNLDAIQEFLQAEHVGLIAFVKADGRVLVSSAQGSEIPPCNGECEALQDVNVANINQAAILATVGSPECITITIGGYTIDIDPKTGKKCKK